MAKRLCPFCKEKVHADATICKHCKSELPPLPPRKWYFTWKGMLLALFTLVIIGAFLQPEHTTKVESTPKTPPPSTIQAKKPRTYSPEQIKAAKTIFKNLKEMANVYEESVYLVVEFYEYLYPYDINARLRFIRAVADADAVLKGESRSIFFYNPNGKLMGKADTLNGIRLVD